MKAGSSWYAKTWWFSLICIGLISVLYIFIEKRNHGINMVDFEVFYKTASRMFHANNLYQVSGDGDYVFKYAPTSAAYFIPFVLIPLSISKIIYWLFLCFLIVEGYYLSGRLFLNRISHQFPGRTNSILLIAFASVFIHIERELVLGQINWVLLVMFLWIATAYVDKKPVQLALSLALSVFIKPFGLIFIPYLILKRKTRELLYFVLFSLVLLVVPLLFYSLPEYKVQLLGWFNELAVELGNKQELASPGIHTVFSLLLRFTPLYFVSFEPVTTFLYQLAVLGILALAVVWFIKMGKGLQHADAENLALLTALIPLLAFTNENAFLFLTPAIIVSLRYFWEFNLTGKILLIMGILLQGGNIRELWGMQLSLLILDYSVVSFGAILIIITLFISRKKHLDQKAEAMANLT